MLNNLPQEILLIIASHLDRIDIINLTLCNHQLYEDLHLEIYRDIGVKDKCFWVLSRLVCLMLRKPEYAHAVRHLSISPARPRCTCGRCNDIVFDRELIEPVIDSIFDGLEEQVDWYGDLIEGSLDDGITTDAWIALLLPHLTNLQSFRMILGSSPWMARVLSKAQERQGQFPEAPIFLPRLTKFIGFGHEVGEKILEAIPFFRLPSLRKFRVVGKAFQTSKKSHLLMIPQGFSNATDLSIHAIVSGPRLQPLVDSCKRLEHFVYTQTCGRLTTMNSPIRVHKLLYRHRETLQSLTFYAFDLDFDSLYPKKTLRLDVEDSSDDESSDTNLNDEFFGSFADFSSLRVIHLRANNLVDPIADPDPTHDMRRLGEYLPSSLEILRLKDFTACDTSRLSTQLEYLFSIAKQHFPNLVKIVLGVDFPAFSYSSHESKPPSKDLSPIERQLSSLKGHDLYVSLKPLCLLCNEAGVKFRISHRKANCQTWADIF